MTGDARRIMGHAAASTSDPVGARAHSLPDWAKGLVATQGLGGLVAELTLGLPAAFGFRDAALLLQDPEFEIARLLADEFGSDGLPTRLHLVDSLIALAPQTAALRRPWCGRYAAVDHGLLLPGATGVEQIVILPLGRAGRISALLCLGGASTASGEFAGADLLAQIAALATLALDAALDRQRLAQVGFDDPLTGWHRERYLWARLREELARSARASTPVALLAVDVRDFRAINAALGRAAGDRVLRELTARVDAVVREGDSTVRLVGDRFMLLLAGTDADGTMIVVERMLAAIEGTPFDLGDGRPLPVRAAVGSAVTTAARGADLKTAAECLYAEALVSLARAKRC